MKLLSMIKIMHAELSTPDAQNLSWYFWCVVQCGHAMLGVVIAMHAGIHAVLIVAILALLKEAFDLLQKHDAQAAIDSMQDVSFWIIGAWIITATDKNLATAILLMALVCGVIPRIRKVKLA